MKVLVTGGSGFLGSHICPMLRRNHIVIITDIDDMNVTEYPQVSASLRHEQPDVIIHLAAKAGGLRGGCGEESRSDPWGYLSTNILGTLNVYEACRVLGIRKVILMSSFSTYGVTRGVIDEHTKLNPVNPYGVSKLCSERIAKAYSDLYDIRSIVFRAPFIVGENQKEWNALNEFVDSALSGQPLVIYGEGLHKREWVHPEDVGRAFLRALDYFDRMKRCFEVFVLGNKENLVSMLDLAKFVQSKVGKGEIIRKDVKAKVWDQTTCIDKSRRILGWQPEINLEKIVERVIEARKIRLPH